MPSSRRVLLVNPSPVYAGSRSAARSRMQPSLVSLFTYLSARGVPVDVLDLHVEVGVPADVAGASHAATEALALTLARDFDVLAVSCNSSYHYLPALDLAAGVRAAAPDVTIVAGGCHATAAPLDFAFPGSPFDIVVRGEGELELEAIAAETARPASTAVRVGRPLPLDRFYADFTGYPYWIGKAHILPFPLSRGCPFSCVFCAGADHEAWRAYPPQVAIALVRQMAATGAEVLLFCDPCFGLRSRWRREFLRSLAELSPEQAIQLETRVDTLDDESIDLLASVDCLVGLGLESGSPRMLETMRKAPDGAVFLRRSLELLEQLGRRHIPTNVYLLVNHPGEDRESLSATVELARSTASMAPAWSAYATGHAYIHFPGTAVDDDLSEWRARGTRFEHPRWWAERGPQGRWSDRTRTQVSADDIEEALADIQRSRAAAVAAMPAAARLTWRRVRAPLRLPRTLGGLGPSGGPAHTD
jgi:hypothetical protein